MLYWDKYKEVPQTRSGWGIVIIYVPTMITVETGASNTPSECQKVSVLDTKLNSLSPADDLYVGIDWLQWISVIHSSEIERLVDFCSGSFDDEFSLMPGVAVTRGKTYQNSGRSVRGGAIAWNTDENGVAEVWVSLPAAVLAQSDVKGIWFFAHGLKKAYNARFTRVDVRLDDYQKQLDPHVILAAYDSGNYARFDYIDPHFPRSKGVVQGFTLYMGHPKSEKRARFYDKFAESKGQIDCYRLETQFRRGSADVAMNYFLQIEGEYDLGDSKMSGAFEPELSASFLSGLVTGAIDFPDRSGGERLSRCEKLDWWESFLLRVGSVLRLSSSRPKPSLERTITWIEKQVQVSIALLRDVFGASRFRAWISNQADAGQERYRDYHQKIINVAKSDVLNLEYVT